MRRPSVLWQLALTALVPMVALVPCARAARFLAIFPTPSISHQLPFQEPVNNYSDIDLSFSYETFRKSATFAEMADGDAIALIRHMTPTLKIIVDEQLASKQIQNFLRYNASEKFDLVFIEALMYQAYYGLLHTVGSPPLIGMVSLGGLAFNYNAIGNPHNPAVNPDIFSKNSENMNFWERLENTYIYLWLSQHWYWTILPQQEALMRKYFGQAPPPVAETEYNMSLMILCNHWTTEYPRALLPNVVQLTGLHVREETRPFPPELRRGWTARSKESSTSAWAPTS
ncbi:UDP-glucuronosyltransferase 2B15 [Gryllus bimaculatus]|nr:UDP-glucuronosyltransferase 2B15 [Gryllus bimaculatus]